MRPRSKKIKEYIEKEQKLWLRHKYGANFETIFKKSTEEDRAKFYDAYVDFKIKNVKAREKLKAEIKNHKVLDDSTPYESYEHRQILNSAKDYFLSVNPEKTEAELPHLATLFSHDICAEVTLEPGEPVIFFYGELLMANLLFAKIFSLSIPYEFTENSEIMYRFESAAVTPQAYSHLEKILDLLYNTINKKPHNANSYLIKDEIHERIAYQLLESILLFVFAHEVGHVDLNHDFASEDKEINWREEYEADIFAADNLIKNFHLEEKDYPMLLMGPFVFFHYLAIIESESDSQGNNTTHPPAMQRLNKYLFHLNKNLPENEMRIVNNHILGFKNIFDTFLPFINNFGVE